MSSEQDRMDSLDSLHLRMDKFYDWAATLMVQHRDLKLRLGFLEAAMPLLALKNEEADNNNSDDDDELLASRLLRAKQ